MLVIISQFGGGLSGYVVDFLNDSMHGAYIFEPCNVDEAIKAFNNIDYEH